MGHINYSELPFHYSKAHFFILPSQNEGETFGRVWVEAMALSKPIVSTGLDNLTNLVSDGVNGFIVDQMLQASH